MADDTPASESAPTLEARIETAIRAWRDDLIAGGPIARVTECWNHLEQSLQPLIAAIMKEL